MDRICLQKPLLSIPDSVDGPALPCSLPPAYSTALASKGTTADKAKLPLKSESDWKQGAQRFAVVRDREEQQGNLGRSGALVPLPQVGPTVAYRQDLFKVLNQ